MNWAVSTEIVNGSTHDDKVNYLDPTATALRCQAAAVACRYLALSKYEILFRCRTPPGAAVFCYGMQCKSQGRGMVQMENAEWKMESYAKLPVVRCRGAACRSRRSAYDSYRLTIKR